jgi:hypothetical protein
MSAGMARAGEAVRHAKRGRIHTFVSTSPIHLAHQMRKSQDEVIAIILKTVAQARDLVEDVEWSAMDATRTPLDYLCRCVEAAIKAGATTINLPDTVGYATPTEYRDMFANVRERVPNADKAVFSVHCHNDLGLAIANSLAGIEGGARQVECTINGIGERAGNAALEEIVMALRTRADVLPYETGVESTMLTRASKLVSHATNFPVQFNKAIVGRNAFAHESGIHQDGMLKHANTYEIMTPASVGLTKTALVMGKHSGRAAFRDKLTELGLSLSDNQVQRAGGLLGIDAERCVQVSNGFDPEVFRPRPLDRAAHWRRHLVDEPQGWRPGEEAGSVGYAAEDLAAFAGGRLSRRPRCRQRASCGPHPLERTAGLPAAVTPAGAGSGGSIPPLPTSAAPSPAYPRPEHQRHDRHV